RRSPPEPARVVPSGTRCFFVQSSRARCSLRARGRDAPRARYPVPYPLAHPAPCPVREDGPEPKYRLAKSPKGGWDLRSSTFERANFARDGVRGRSPQEEK